MPHFYLGAWDSVSGSAGTLTFIKYCMHCTPCMRTEHAARTHTHTLCTALRLRTAEQLTLPASDARCQSCFPSQCKVCECQRRTRLPHLDVGLTGRLCSRSALICVASRSSYQGTVARASTWKHVWSNERQLHLDASKLENTLLSHSCGLRATSRRGPLLPACASCSAMPATRTPRRDIVLRVPRAIPSNGRPAAAANAIASGSLLYGGQGEHGSSTAASAMASLYDRGTREAWQSGTSARRSASPVKGGPSRTTPHPARLVASSSGAGTPGKECRFAAESTSAAEWNSLLIWARRQRGPQWDSGTGM
jgi:hypothetical protein